jgi:hypothetical protein
MAGPDAESTAGSLVHLPFYDLEARVGTGVVQVSVDACSGYVYPQRIPPGSPGAGRTGPQGAWLAAVAVLVMVAEAAAIRSPWLAGLTVAITAVLSALMLRAGVGPGRQAGG